MTTEGEPCDMDDVQARALWVSVHIMPHELKIRRWLGRWGISQDERDELLQDAYFALWNLGDTGHIEEPLAYFFSIVRNLLSKTARRHKVVPIDLLADIDLNAQSSEASPEQQAADRIDCARLLAIIERLPARCRQTVLLRKVEGWSQKQIALHLGVSEKTVEAQIWLGVKAVRAEWSRLYDASDTSESGRFNLGGRRR